MIRALAFALFASGLCVAADPVATTVPVTQMLVPGKVILDEPLNVAFGKEWKVGKGEWKPVDGALRGAEVAADMHGAVARRNLDMKDTVIAVSFKLDGAKAISLSFNGAKGHVSRVRVTPTGVSVQKDDQDGKNGPDKAAVLDTASVTIKPGEWHHLVVELRGADLLATLDGKHTTFGTHEAIAKDRTNLGLTVAGETASWKGLKVWEASGPAKGWEETKKKLLESKKK